MAMLTVKINGQSYTATAGDSILDLCQRAAIHVPTLCHHADLNNKGICRICVVEVAGSRTLQAACSTPLEDGMEITTTSERIRRARKTIVELLLANHYTDCTVCPKNLKCELQALANEYRLTNLRWKEHRERTIAQDTSSEVFVRDNNKCILCQRCIRACNELQSVAAVANLWKGDSTAVGSAYNWPIAKVVCINCGQCVAHCPTGALYEKSALEEVWRAIDDPQKTVVVQTAPAIRAAIGEEFGLAPGSRVTSKLASALRTIGFDFIFDTQFAADLTIMEEGTELLGRLKTALSGGRAALPMMTSCSPGWIKFQEHFFPALLPNLSSCRSPQQMMGSLIRSYWTEKTGFDPDSVVSVSIMPCTAKKFEAARPEMTTQGRRDVDYVLTTRELAVMIKQAGLDLSSLPDGSFDDPLGESTGAATIFGTTGGVMEAALRTAYAIVTGREVPFDQLNIIPVRGMAEIRRANIEFTDTLPEWRFLEGRRLQVMAAYGTANARQLMEGVGSGKIDAQFIEIMTCPGGCLGGGGQPLPSTAEIRAARAQALYDEDASLRARASHHNAAVQRLYESYLGKPNGPRAHQLLHTDYNVRGRY